MAYITVENLIEQLQELDPNAIVLLSEDAEGNGFRPLSEAFSTGAWDDTEDEFYDANLEGECEWDGEYCTDGKDCEYRQVTPDTAVAAIILWPS